MIYCILSPGETGSQFRKWMTRAEGHERGSIGGRRSQERNKREPADHPLVASLGGGSRIKAAILLMALEMG